MFSGLIVRNGPLTWRAIAWIDGVRIRSVPFATEGRARDWLRAAQSFTR